MTEVEIITVCCILIGLAFIYQVVREGNGKSARDATVPGSARTFTSVLSVHDELRVRLDDRQWVIVGEYRADGTVDLAASRLPEGVALYVKVKKLSPANDSVRPDDEPTAGPRT